MKSKAILTTLMLIAAATSLADDARVSNGTISLDRAALSRSGIVTAALRSATYQQSIQAYGVVLSAQNLVDLRYRMVMARSQLEKATASLEISKQEYERMKSLHDDGHNVSDKALQAAEGMWRTDEASLKAAREALDAVADDARLQWGNAIAGAVLHGNSLFDRLADRREVLIQITAPSGLIVPAAPATAELQANGSRVTASLLSPSPKTDPKFQGVSFFYHAPSSVLVPGMTVTAYLPVGSPLQGVVVPASAAVWWQGSDWVYVEQKPGHFVRRKLPTDAPVAEGWFSSSGFKTGESVVVTGAQQLLSQEFHAQIQSDDEGDQD